MRIIKEAIKGPSIDWDNYLTSDEILALKLHLHTFTTIIQRLLDEGRLIPTDNKTFDDLLDELKSWWEHNQGDINKIYEKRLPSQKANDYYYKIRNHAKKLIELNPGRDVKMDNKYFDENESLKMYKDLKKIVISHIRLRDTDLKLGVIDKEKYDLDNKIDDIVLDYVNQRIESLTRLNNDSLKESLLLEKGRNDLLSKSKKDSPGRWERRQYYKNFKVVKTDISDLDDKDRITVTFEVGDYKDTVAFNNILLNLREIVKNDPKHMVKFDWVIRACNKAIDQSDIFVNCTCKDFKYRLAYIASKDSYKYGKKEMRPANITNPNDDKGSMCKHLLSILSNKSWMTRVATTVNDWLQMKDVYEIRELLNYEEANMPTEISRELGKMSARAKGVR